MPKGTDLISLIFPAYNPGPGLGASWEGVRDFLRDRPQWEVLFVLDGCSDGSETLLRRLTAGEGPRVRVLSYERNRGKGAAVRVGMLAASGDYRIFTDVDLAYGFADVVRVHEQLQFGRDVVIASRDHPESEMVLPVKMLPYMMRRHIQSRIFGGLARILLPIRQKDTQAGLKGFSAKASEAIFPHLQCDGFGFDCELLTACARLGFAVEEMPVQVRYDSQATTTGFRTVRRMLGELWKVRRDWNGRVPPARPLPTLTDATGGEKKAA